MSFHGLMIYLESFADFLSNFTFTTDCRGRPDSASLDLASAMSIDISFCDM
jgi:hypothetical protein